MTLCGFWNIITFAVMCTAAHTQQYKELCDEKNFFGETKMKSPLAEHSTPLNNKTDRIYTEETVDTMSALCSDVFSHTSSYPVILCDDELYVADISLLSRSLGISCKPGSSVKEHLSKKDISAILSCIEHLKSSPYEAKDMSMVVDLNGIKGYSCAFVTFTELFSCIFAEMKLFSDRISLLKNFKVSELMMSGFPVFDEEYDESNIYKIKDAASKIFLQSRFQNMYHAAQSPFGDPCIFNAFELTRYIITDFSHSLDTGVDFVFSAEGNENFQHAVIDAANYVNLISVLMMFCANVTESGVVEAKLSHSENRVSLILSTNADDCILSFVGGFAFSFLAKMYPYAASYVYAAEYISRLFGLRCYAELSGENTLSVELLITPAPPGTEIGCMHIEGKKTKQLCSRALSLVNQLDGARFND